MNKVFLACFIIVTTLGVCTANSQVNVQMVFGARERHASKDVLRHDTCEIVSGATRGVDNNLGEIDIPGIPSNTFYSVLIEDGGALVFRREMLPPPSRSAPPFIVDFTFQYQLDVSNDTLVISWNALPFEIDSILLEDSVGWKSPSSYIHRVISHSTAYPDSLLWSNPTGIEISFLRIRMYCNATITGVHGGLGLDPQSQLLAISPQPAHDRASIVGTSIGPGTTIEVRDMLGRLALHTVAESGSADLRLYGLVPGTYSVVTVNHLSVSRALLVVE